MLEAPWQARPSCLAFAAVGVDEQPEGPGQHPHIACRMGVGGPMHSMKRWMYIFV